MKSNQQALQELQLAETEKPYVDEQFIIFRQRKLIEEEIFEQSNNNKGQKNMDAMNELTTENNLREIRQNIETSSSFHIEFWS